MKGGGRYFYGTSWVERNLVGVGKGVTVGDKKTRVSAAWRTNVAVLVGRCEFRC